MLRRSCLCGLKVPSRVAIHMHSFDGRKNFAYKEDVDGLVSHLSFPPGFADRFSLLSFISSAGLSLVSLPSLLCTC